MNQQKDARVCAQLFCFDSSSGYCVSYRPAAEGSPCGDGQVSEKDLLIMLISLLTYCFIKLFKSGLQKW